MRSARFLGPAAHLASIHLALLARSPSVLEDPGDVQYVLQVHPIRTIGAPATAPVARSWSGCSLRGRAVSLREPLRPTLGGIQRDRLSSSPCSGEPRRARAPADTGRPRGQDGGGHDSGPLRVGVAGLSAVLHPLGRRRSRRADRRAGDPRDAPRRCQALRTPRRRRRAHGSGAGARGRQGGRPRRHGAFRVVGARRLVRGGRAGLRPSAQSVLAGRCHPFDPHGAGGVPRCGVGRVHLTRHVLRDGIADPLLPESDGRRLLAPGSDRHRKPPVPTRASPVATGHR